MKQKIKLHREKSDESVVSLEYSVRLLPHIVLCLFKAKVTYKLLYDLKKARMRNETDTTKKE